MPSILKLLAASSLLCAILTGCGQTGPLYLPQEPPPAPAENPEPNT